MKNRSIKENYWFFYVVECSDKTFYAGITTDLDRRITKHNEGKGAKYTKGRGPVKLLARKRFPNQSEALKAEHNFKKLSRKEKEKFINK